MIVIIYFLNLKQKMIPDEDFLKNRFITLLTLLFN